MAVKTFTDNTALGASDINTYLNNGGLVYIKSQTIGTAVSSVTVSDAFSATFDNYLVTVENGTASTNSALNLQLGSTTTGYYDTGIYIQIGGALGTYTNSNASNFASAVYMSTTQIGGRFSLFDPYLAKNTMFESTAMQCNTSGFMNNARGFLNNTTSYTAFTLISGAGTVTGGTITVYGYRKA